MEAQKADNKLKHFFECNATLDKWLELWIIEDQNATVTKEGWSYPHHCNGERPCGTTTVSSTRGTLVLKRWWKLWYTGKDAKDSPIHNKIMQVMLSE
jgi:hypothetical protein